MGEREDTRRALAESITVVRRILNEHHEYLKRNETATRALVIDRLLTVLGWDIRDPARVWLEHSANKNKMDYVLRSSSDRPLGVVEAKAAGLALGTTFRRDASGYATEIGASYAVLTNGGRWEAWEMAQHKPRQDCIVVEVNLTTGEIGDLAATLAKLHRDSLDQALNSDDETVGR